MYCISVRIMCNYIHVVPGFTFIFLYFFLSIYLDFSGFSLSLIIDSADQGHHHHGYGTMMEVLPSGKQT
jgi:hypothetical protein